MKRILPLVLTVLLLPALLAVPAMADEVTESGTYNVLDFSTANDSGSNVVLSASGVETFFQLVQSTTIYRVQALVRFVNGVIPSNSYVRIGNKTYELQMVALGNNYYHLSCETSKTSGTLFFSFTCEGSTQVSFLEVEVDTFDSIYRTLSAELSGLMYNGTTFSVSYSGASYVVADWSGAGISYDQRTFSSYLIVTGNVHVYDYVDVSLTLNVEDIESISVDDSLNPLPYEINSIYQATANTPEQPNTIVTLRIDVRGLEDGYKPIVRITGYSSSETNRYTISYVGGVLVIDSPDPLLYWFTKLNAWMTIQTSSIVNSITTWGQNIVDALGGSNDASKVQDNINAAVGELQQAGAALDAVDRPDIGHVNIDVAGMVDPVGLTGVAAIVALFTGNSLIYTIMLMFVTLALISYILYGKG